MQVTVLAQINPSIFFFYPTHNLQTVMWILSMAKKKALNHILSK